MAYRLLQASADRFAIRTLCRHRPVETSMKTLLLALFATVTLAGCVVVPAEAPVPYVAPPRAYISPPSLIVAPSFGYYGGHRHHGYHGRGYWR